MPKKKEPEAVPEKEKPKAASGITPPIEMERAAPARPVTDAWVPPHEDVKALAIAMCLANREPKPEIFVGGMPLWRQWENAAVNALAAQHWLETRNG